MTIKDSLSSNIVGHWDFRKGTIKDQSSNSNDGSFSGSPPWRNTSKGKSLEFQSTNIVTVSDSVELQATNMSVIIFGDFQNQTSGARFFSKRDAGGTHIDFFNFSASNLGVFDGTSTSDLAADITNVRMIGFTLTSGSLPEFYLDGVNVGDGDVTITISANDAPIAIGNFHTGNNPALNKFNEVLYFNTALTEQQMSELYNEWLQEAHLDKIPTSTIMPNLMAVPEFDRDTIWTKGTGWTITGGQASCDGSQAGVSDLSQAIGVVGNTYTIEYEVSGYSAGNVTGLAGDATGTARNANGVYFDTITATADTDLGLQADVNFIGNIEYVKISLSTKLDLNFTGEDIEVTTANQTSGFLSNSIFTINSGTWSVVDIGTQKVLNCVANGQLQLFFAGADNLTTTTFETISGTPTITKNALNIQLDALAGEQIGIIRLSPT